MKNSKVKRLEESAKSFESTILDDYKEVMSWAKWKQLITISSLSAISGKYIKEG